MVAMSIKTDITASAAKAARKRTYRDGKPIFASDYQFDYDTTLLEEGKYREWFYQGLHESSLMYLCQPARMPLKIEDKREQPGYWQENQPRPGGTRPACADADPVIFFSESHFPKRDYSDPDAKWRQYCPQCPMRESCLQTARDSGSVGIWGGKYRGYKGNSIEELDDETMPKVGRPRKTR